MMTATVPQNRGPARLRAGPLFIPTLTFAPRHNVFVENLLAMALLAQEGDPAALVRTFLPLVMIMVLGYFLLWVPEKRRRNALKEKLDSMKENDHVITAGGIHGTVTGIRRDQDMVTIRIDESTGTKIRLGRSAIAQVLSDDDSNDTDPKTKT
ncbi:MAG: preprotein translocase subunit YajC [Pirellulales bacterium]|jgi:preprotein translocase subunit YajC|nr:preprotein translocase subunit YajC [Pirellulales bacterium]